jgi:hypothetical protein
VLSEHLKIAPLAQIAKFGKYPPAPPTCGTAYPKKVNFFPALAQTLENPEQCSEKKIWNLPTEATQITL